MIIDPDCIVSKHWKTIGWIVSIFVSVTIVQLLIRLPNEIITSEVLLLILIVLFICFLILQSIKTAQDLNLMNSLDRIPYEIVQPILQKKLTFNGDSLNTKKCTSELFRVLKNNMEDDAVYNDFKVEYSSRDSVPCLNDIKAYVQKEEVDLRKIPPLTCIICESDGTFSKVKSTKNTEISFDIPVGIESGEEKSLRVVFQTDAFKKALAGKKDSITLNCARITEKIIFEIQLVGSIRKSHHLSKCDEKDIRRGSPLEFIIEDGSDQRMITSEIELRKKKHVPSWKEHTIIWQIPNPKVNYNYILYFTIKENKVTTIQEPLIIEDTPPVQPSLELPQSEKGGDKTQSTPLTEDITPREEPIVIADKTNSVPKL